MPWGDPGVSKKLRLSNGVVNFGTGGQPVPGNIQPTGILRALRMLMSATPTFVPGTGVIARDVNGPWNVLTQVLVSPNQQAPVVQVSGYGLYLINCMLSEESGDVGLPPDVAAVAETSSETATDIYSASATSGTTPWKFPLFLPISQRVRSLGGDIGMWPLQNPSITLQASYTPNSSSQVGPYNIYSLTAGQSPYLVTNNATVTLTNPGIEFIRELWQVPASQSDFPPFQVVSSWIEEQPQGSNVNGATSFSWLMTPLSGILVRLGVYIYDGAQNGGVLASNLTASNALLLSYDATTPKFSESAQAALARQRQHFTFDLPQGFYTYNLMGKDLTLQDTLDSHTTGNIKFTANFNAALGSTNSSAKIIKQVISPLEVH